MKTVRHKFVAAIIPLIFAVPSLAADIALPNEAVTVSDDSLVGIWKVTMPQGFDFSFFHKTKWGPQVDAYCQIEQSGKKLTIHCLGFRIGSNDVSHGTLSMEGRTVRMTWGSTFFYAAINGTRRSATQFDGTFFVEGMGVSDDAPGKVAGIKLTLASNAPDKGGKLHSVELLLDKMSKGLLNVAPDANAAGVRVLSPDTLHSLGDVQSIIYVGETNSVFASPASVYDIEFSNGHLICSLHEDANNKLDQFDCG
jgi:hypothetical protein